MPFSSFAPNFTYKELTNSMTTLPNDPEGRTLSVLRALSWILQDIRNKFGKAIYINSAYRSHVVNQAVGGVATSYHLYGKAADISIRKYTKDDLKTLENIIKSRKPIEFIKYDTFWHIAFDIYSLGPSRPIVTYQEKYPDEFPAGPVRSADVENDDI